MSGFDSTIPENNDTHELYSGSGYYEEGSSSDEFGSYGSGSGDSNLKNETESYQPGYFFPAQEYYGIVSIDDRHLYFEADVYYNQYIYNLNYHNPNSTNATTNTTSQTLPGSFQISKLNLSLEYSRICGLPGFCKPGAYDTCFNTSLSNCDDCSKTGSIFFILFVVCLGLAILIGNLMILAVGWKRQKAGKASKMDVCRCSLAIADLLTGIQLLTVVVYNYSWSISLTAYELDREQLALRSTTKVLIGAIFFCLGYVSSLYNLFFIGLLRLYAIWKPINYKNQSKLTLQTGLCLVWIFSFVSATILAWFPEHFTGTYFASIFLYTPTIQRITINQDNAPLVALFGVFYVFPYVLVTFTIIASGFLVGISHVKRAKRLNAQPQAKKLFNQRKTAALVTVAIMQLGFTVSLIPLAVVLIMFYAGILDCSNVSTPYMICIYISMTNSFFNVVIYNVRDKAFRATVKELFCLNYCPRNFKFLHSSTSNNPSKSKAGKNCPLPTERRI